jgi:peptidoglycan/LPS O-acetylase OafA/YrhL
MADRRIQRFQELDVFRGLAAFMVVFYHFVFWYPILYRRPDSLSASLFIGPPIVPGMPNKYLGLLPVYWFFVISGFVIIWTLESCRTWRDFAVSRFSRLFPTYWAALALTTGVGLLAPLPGQSCSAVQIFANLTMLQQPLGFADIDGAYWSLLVEMLFYIGMAGIFTLGWLPRLHELCLLWVAACVLTHALALFGIDVWWKLQVYGLLPYGHFLAAGILFYQLWQNRRPTLCCYVLLFCLVSIFLAYPLPAALLCTLCFGLFYLAIRGSLRAIVSRPLLWLGGISYALYVCHQMLGYRIIMTLEDYGVPCAAAVACAFAAVLLLAAAIHRGIGLPAMLAIRAA